MNKVKLLLGTALLAGGLALPMLSQADVDLGISLGAPAVEVQPAGYSWAPAHWEWYEGRYVWVEGRWVGGPRYEYRDHDGWDHERREHRHWREDDDD